MIELSNRDVRLRPGSCLPSHRSDAVLKTTRAQNPRIQSRKRLELAVSRHQYQWRASARIIAPASDRNKAKLRPSKTISFSHQRKRIDDVQASGASRTLVHHIVSSSHTSAPTDDVCASLEYRKAACRRRSARSIDIDVDATCQQGRYRDAFRVQICAREHQGIIGRRSLQFCRLQVVCQSFISMMVEHTDDVCVLLQRCNE